MMRRSNPLRRRSSESPAGGPEYRSRLRSATVLLIALVVAAAVLAAAQPAGAASIPAHTSPKVQCKDRGQIAVNLPGMVQTPYRSEEVRLKFHLLKLVNGAWTYQIPSPHYYSNIATSSGVLLNGWSQDGVSNSSFLGVVQDGFTVYSAGQYRVALQIWWMSSHNYTYEFAGDHIYEGWNFVTSVSDRCFYS